MANASTTGFGLERGNDVGNTPATSGQSEYKIKSGLGVGIFQNNPVSFTGFFWRSRLLTRC